MIFVGILNKFVMSWNQLVYRSSRDHGFASFRVSLFLRTLGIENVFQPVEGTNSWPRFLNELEADWLVGINPWCRLLVLGYSFPHRTSHDLQIRVNVRSKCQPSAICDSRQLRQLRQLRQTRPSRETRQIRRGTSNRHTDSIFRLLHREIKSSFLVLRSYTPDTPDTPVIENVNKPK